MKVVIQGSMSARKVAVAFGRMKSGTELAEEEDLGSRDPGDAGTYKRTHTDTQENIGKGWRKPLRVAASCCGGNRYFPCASEEDGSTFREGVPS